MNGVNAYFDNSATTRPCREAVDAVTLAMTELWGNPSSLHQVGIEAEELLEKSRARVAKKLMCRPDEILFTSGGTESNNTALYGAARALKHKGKRIVTSAVEHPSVDETLTHLEQEGFEVIRVPVDSSGRIKTDELYESVNKDTILVSIMAVNNEVGTIQPVEEAKKAVLAAGAPALVHCDGVQVFGKMPFKPRALGIDLMSISSHKIHGPKGVGALYIGNGVRISPRAFGGLQEKQLRPGTEAMPAIAGFGAAANALPDFNEGLKKVTELRELMLRLFSEIGGIAVNSPSDALPYITNISVIGRKSEPMLNFLSDRGVYVSAGSACSKGRKSKVLSAMGLDDARLESPLRISMSRLTTEEEVRYLAGTIADGMRLIRSTGKKGN